MLIVSYNYIDIIRNNMADLNITDTDATPSVRLTGQVKWFNNKAGYGFITVNSGEHAGKDIFIHYSTIMVKNSQYKYLIQGEYVEFELTTPATASHEFQATNISGINGGSLMCETRRSNVQYGDNTRSNAPYTQQSREGGSGGGNRNSRPSTAGRGRGDARQGQSQRQRGPRDGVAPRKTASNSAPARDSTTSESVDGFTTVQRKQRPKLERTSSVNVSTDADTADADAEDQ